MKKYYAERHGLLTKQLQIDFDELLQYFGQVYKYFCDKEYFEVATRGVWRQIPYTQDSEQDFTTKFVAITGSDILQHAYRIKRFGQFGNILKNMMSRHCFQ